MDAPDAPDPQEPPPSKEKRGFKGTRKRSLSYKPKKGSGNTDAVDTATSTIAQPSTTSTTQPSTSSVSRLSETETTAAASISVKCTSKAELLALLKKCENNDLAAARAELLKKDKTINTLENTNNKLVEGTKSARVAAREAKQYAKGVEEDAARSVLMRSRDELAAVEERERAAATEYKKREATLEEKVQKVREEEQVSF